MRCLSTLMPGTRFRLAEMPEVTGQLLRCNACRAVVRLDRPERETEWDDEAGGSRSRRTHVTSWAPATVVEPLDFQELEDEAMSKTKSAKKSDTKGAKAKKAKGDGKLSAIDAAAQVLAESKEPMSTGQMVEQMAAKGLWKSANGQTPAATLYSAILREMQTKGKESRFRKTERGKFARNG